MTATDSDSTSFVLGREAADSTDARHGEATSIRMLSQWNESKTPAVRALVLDTNVVLDLLVFQDPATVAVKRAMADGSLRWNATAPMREELVRVLAYPQIVKSLVYHALEAADVLAGFDAQARLVPVAPKAAVTCKDPDDQKFIDLAVAHKAVLLSKDKAVICMKKRLLALDVSMQTAIE
jgi:putative PIN family toxin of toxin-antitoxin system